MKYNNYAHIELNITSKTKNNIGNSANYKNLARWNDSIQGNITSVGTNGNSSYYDLYDISGQVYEWTDDSDIEYSELKICRGGCYADINPFNVSKDHRQKFHYNAMLNEGFFGFRVATISNPQALSNFINISDTGNAPDKCDENLFGVVNYNYQINRYLVTNNEYCEFLNSADPSGTNIYNLYDVRMGASAVGGIELVDCNNIGSKYIVKPNMSNKPVTFIKWLMAAKYTNWLHNNKTSDPINYLYSGAYNLSTIIEPFNIKTENQNNIISENNKEIITDQNFSILTGELNQNISREVFATYFLPNEDEWYKAAYYDPTIQSYWKYGTKSNNDPYAVLCNSIGSGQYVEGYHYSVKKFPILVSKTTETFSPLPISSDPSSACPYISITGTSANSGLANFINCNISGLVYGEKYTYDFSSSQSNWPCRITPLSGSFTAYNSSQEVNAILQFCPKNYNNILSCNANLPNILDSQTTSYFADLNLKVSSSACSRQIEDNYLISLNNLPTIAKSPYLDIEFLDSHDNSIIVSGNLCCHPIPIIVSVSGHQPGDTYSFTLTSSSNEISFIPDAGIVSFGDQIGKITAYAIGLNSYTNDIAILNATVTKTNDVSITSTDQVLLQCISDCEKSCDNHANFNNQAIWGSCPDNDCEKTIKPRTDGLVTTVGTNGGPGSYGTYDMDGNVYEIVHIDNVLTSTSFEARGGSFKSSAVGKTTSIGLSAESDEIGFRVGSYTNPYNYSNMLPIGDIGPLQTGNRPDTNSLGNVDYNYKIGKYEVTNCEYIEFLNSVASTGITENQSSFVYSPLMSGCYGGINRTVCNGSSTFIYSAQTCMDHKPVRFLPNYAALRYVNWLENQKRNSWLSTTSGTYALGSSVNTMISGNRALCSKYFIPSNNEWYKSAYYKGSNTGDTNAGYWNYSTRASISPDPVKVTGCGDGYSGPDCPLPTPRLPCNPPVCTPTPTPTRTLTPTPTSTPTPTPTPSTSYYYYINPLFINIIP